MLASLNTGAGTAMDDETGPLWPVLAYWGECCSEPIAVFDGFPLDEGDYPADLHLSVSAAVDPDFERFVSMLTDGTGQGQELYQGGWGRNGPRFIGSASEEGWFADRLVRHVPANGADLIGYSVTTITFDGIATIEYDWVGPGGELYTYWAYGGDYRFYGYPIPEPGTLAMVALGALLFGTRRRHG